MDDEERETKIFVGKTALVLCFECALRLAKVDNGVRGGGLVVTV